MDPAVATRDFAKAGAIIVDMIESYLAGLPPSNPAGDKAHKGELHFPLPFGDDDKIELDPDQEV
jgi:hypothetical protein